jgi:RimJ/RimL family protein N-acetyltransferase
MAVFCKTEALKRALEALPQVVSVAEIKVEDHIVQYISIETSATGRVTVSQLDVHDAPRLFEFYAEGLSEKPRRLFAPYPLFQTPPGSANELAWRIADWKRENDWSAVNLVQNERVIGFGLLKRFRTEQVTSAIVIRDEFMKRGLGHLLQQVIIEQARLLNLKRFHIKVISDNLASVRLHEKCGFRQTRILSPPLYEEMLDYLRDRDRKNGAEAVDRRIIEMVIDLICCNH